MAKTFIKISYCNLRSLGYTVKFQQDNIYFSDLSKFDTIEPFVKGLNWYDKGFL